MLASILGKALGYAPRDLPYNVGPNDPYNVAVESGYLQGPSERLFWSNGQGTNQVGGTGLWASITNKFPFLATMFGRMEQPHQYGTPQYSVSGYQPQYYTPQNYYPQQFYPQQQYFGGNFVPSFTGRDVGFTDDAVIVTPPHVPISAPAPEPSPGGYTYNKPQYRLELPQK